MLPLPCPEIQNFFRSHYAISPYSVNSYSKVMMEKVQAELLDIQNLWQSELQQFTFNLTDDTALQELQPTPVVQTMDPSQSTRIRHKTTVSTRSSTTPKKRFQKPMSQIVQQNQLHTKVTQTVPVGDNNELDNQSGPAGQQNAADDFKTKKFYYKATQIDKSRAPTTNYKAPIQSEMTDGKNSFNAA